MAINFPSSPSVGQKHPTTPVAGLPTYTWDGEKWTTVSSAVEGYGYVLKSGDTMSGDLIVSKAYPGVNLNKTSSGQTSYINGSTNNLARWGLVFGDQVAESGSNVGSDFNILRYNDAGAFVDIPLNINRATGRMTVVADLMPNVTGTVNLGSAALRWGTVFTSDLDLNNGVGDWTIVEGADELFIHNNKRGKTYKFVMVEVAQSRVPPKKV